MTHSFKGGTGKTAIATNFAYYLSQKGYKILLLDGDLTAPSFTKIIPPPVSNPKTWPMYLEEKYELDQVIYNTPFENIDIIYAPNPEIGQNFLSETQNWWIKALKQQMLARKLWFNEFGYDFVVLDNQNGLSMNAANNYTISDIGFLILRPVTYGISGSANIIREMSATLRPQWKRMDFLLWNQVPRHPDLNFIVDELIANWTSYFAEKGIETIAQIDYMPEFSISMLQHQENHLLGVYDPIQEKIASICQTLGLGE